jgi:putative ATP-dependent endonuclease of the OLD family
LGSRRLDLMDSPLDHFLNTFLLTRAAGGKLETMCVADATGLKENDYKRYARKGLAECMLGKGVVIVEGATESHALPVLARCL